MFLLCELFLAKIQLHEEARCICISKLNHWMVYFFEVILRSWFCNSFWLNYNTKTLPNILWKDVVKMRLEGKKEAGLLQNKILFSRLAAQKNSRHYRFAILWLFLIYLLIKHWVFVFVLSIQLSPFYSKNPKFIVNRCAHKFYVLQNVHWSESAFSVPFTVGRKKFLLNVLFSSRL